MKRRDSVECRYPSCECPDDGEPCPIVVSDDCQSGAHMRCHLAGGCGDTCHAYLAAGFGARLEVGSVSFRLLFASFSLGCLLALGLHLYETRSEPLVAVSTSSDRHENIGEYVAGVLDARVPPTAPSTTTTRAKSAVGKVPVVGDVWHALCQCESGGNWSIYNPPYEGGVQFHHATWDAYAPEGFPADAHLASREQQIVVAQLVLADQGWRAWPTCARLLGLL